MAQRCGRKRNDVKPKKRETSAKSLNETCERPCSTWEEIYYPYVMGSVRRPTRIFVKRRELAFLVLLITVYSQFFT